MPKVASMPPAAAPSNELPESLKPYNFHGCDLTIQGKEAVGDCPFCGRDDNKFTVNVETGQWRCLVCGGGLQKGGGGPIDFIRLLYEISDKGTTGEHYAALAKERGFDNPDTIVHWGLAKSAIDGSWLMPGWGFSHTGEREFSQLYSFRPLGARMAWMPTPGRKHTLVGLPLYQETNEHVHVCEGFWDAMRWWESLSTTKADEEGNLSATASPENSMLQGINVLAAATCSSFPLTVGKLFKGKITTFLYDSDHPGTNKQTGNPMPPAGYAGMQRDTAKVVSVAKEVNYLCWGPEGYDPSLKSGHDLSDELRGELKYQGIARIFDRIEETPLEWRAANIVGGNNVGPRPCSSFKELVNYWRKALKWTEGLEHGLVSGLASIVSTNSVGDQLWLKIIGPASCGKSTLCEAWSVNKKHVLAKSSIRGFHSGYKTESASSGEDNSLLVQVKNRTLVTKDGDTLLQAPNLGQILGEARDIYDSVSRTHYRNQMSKDYEGIRMTWLLCGTSSLRSLDSSELGERFLDCVIMQRIDQDLEDEILWRKVNQAAGHVGLIVTEENTTHYSPELLEAMERTAGYIDYLKANEGTMLGAVKFPEESMRKCVDLGKFVAFMRARPSKMQNEEAERELAARLVSQHTRYAKCAAYVMNKAEVDSDVLARTRRIALDTARGVVLEIMKLVYAAEDRGTDYRAVSLRLATIEENETKKLMKFLTSIEALQFVSTPSRKTWIVPLRMKQLFERVMRPKMTWIHPDEAMTESDYESP